MATRVVDTLYLRNNYACHLMCKGLVECCSPLLGSCHELLSDIHQRLVYFRGLLKN